jgi:hypothetical protein
MSLAKILYMKLLMLAFGLISTPIYQSHAAQICRIRMGPYAQSFTLYVNQRKAVTLNKARYRSKADLTLAVAALKQQTIKEKKCDLYEKYTC